MVEKIVLRKGSVERAVVLEGCVTRVTQKGQKPRRTSWLNGVMARARRDAIVSELVAAGWATVEQKKRASTKKRSTLRDADIAVTGKRAPFRASPRRTWPDGYARFAEKFGSGELEDLLVLPPAAVTRHTRTWRTMAPHVETLFENARECFPAGDEAFLIVLARSQNGDTLGFVEARPNELFLFPRGSSRVLAFGSSFHEALGEWCYGEQIAERRVEGRKARFVTSGSTPARPREKVRS